MLVCVHGIYYVCAYVSWTLASPNILPCVVSIVSWPDRVLWRVRSGWGDAAVLREKKHPAALPWRARWAKIFRFASQAPNSNDVPKVSTIPTVIQLDRSPPTTPKCRAVASLSGSCTQRILHSCLVWIVHSADSPQYSFFLPLFKFTVHIQWASRHHDFVHSFFMLVLGLRSRIAVLSRSQCAGWEWWYELDHPRQVLGVCRAKSNLHRCWRVSCMSTRKGSWTA